MSVFPIVMEVPVTIRSFVRGGMGGYGHSTTEVHRLTKRHVDSDETACGMRLRGEISVKEGKPKKADIAKYGACKKCWPEAP